MDLKNNHHIDQWLSLFTTKSDRMLALRLLERLRYVSIAQMMSYFEQQLRDIQKQVGGTIAVFPLENSERKFKSIYSEEDLCSQDGVLVEFFTRKSNVGRRKFKSSDMLSYLIGKIEKRNKKIQLRPTTHGMRATKVNAIVLIDDIVCSGQSYKKFIKENLSKTIKSWVSGQLVTIYLVTYAIHSEGLKTITKNYKGLHKENIRHAIEADMDFDAFPPRLDELLKQYGVLTCRGNAWNGFEGTTSDIVFEHHCPNNAPAILWAPANSKMKGLFEDCSVPPSLSFLFSLDPSERDVETLLNHGQFNLALEIQERVEKHSLSQEDRKLLLLLGLFARKLSLKRVRSCWGGTSENLDLISSGLIEQGLLTSEYKVTPFGYDLLSRFRKKCKVKATLERDEHPPMYFPESFNGVSRSSSTCSDSVGVLKGEDSSARS